MNKRNSVPFPKQFEQKTVGLSKKQLDFLKNSCPGFGTAFWAGKTASAVRRTNFGVLALLLQTLAGSGLFACHSWTAKFVGTHRSLHKGSGLYTNTSPCLTSCCWCYEPGPCDGGRQKYFPNSLSSKVYLWTTCGPISWVPQFPVEVWGP